MKKFILAGTLLGLLFPFAAFASFNTNLQYGSTGSEVSALQVFLSGQNLYTGPITGTFGPLTKKALIAFQQAQGITPAAGFFGALTRAQANQLLTSASASSASTINPNQSLVIPQVAAAATPISQPANAENFTFNGNTYNYEQLPVGMSVVPQGAAWTQATTQYGTVWINNQDFSVPASNVCNDIYYQSCPTGESLVCSGTTAYCETPAQQTAQSQATAQAAAEAQCQAQIAQVQQQITNNNNYYAGLIDPLVAKLSTTGIALGQAGAIENGISQEIQGYAEAEQMANEAIQQELQAAQSSCPN